MLASEQRSCVTQRTSWLPNTEGCATQAACFGRQQSRVLCPRSKSPRKYYTNALMIYNYHANSSDISPSWRATSQSNTEPLTDMQASPPYASLSHPQRLYQLKHTYWLSIPPPIAWKLSTTQARQGAVRLGPRPQCSPSTPAGPRSPPQQPQRLRGSTTTSSSSIHR